MNRDLYIELLEEKVSKLENELDKAYASEAFIIGIIYEAEENKHKQLKTFEKIAGSDSDIANLYRAEWSSLYDLVTKIKEQKQE